MAGVLTGFEIESTIYITFWVRADSAGRKTDADTNANRSSDLVSFTGVVTSVAIMHLVKSASLDFDRVALEREFGNIFTCTRWESSLATSNRRYTDQQGQT